MKASKFSYALRALGSILVFLVCVNCGDCKKKGKSCTSSAQSSDIAADTPIMREVDDAGFGDFIKNEGVVLVFFSKDTCPKCVPVKELLNEIVAENGDKYPIGRVDAAVNTSATASCGVTATPTIILYKNGEEVARFEGSVEKSVLLEALSK